MARWPVSPIYCPLVTIVAVLLYGDTLVRGISLPSDPELADYSLQDLLYGPDDSGDTRLHQIKRLNPGSFSFNRGRRTHEISDFDVPKRLNPSSFGFSRGKKSYSFDELEDDIPDRASELFNIHIKRGRRSSYLGDYSGSDELSAQKREPPRGYIVVRGKRAPPSGFSGLRGKKVPPSGFSGLRGRKRTPPSGFSGLRGRKRAPPSGFSGLRGRKRAPPSGFSGLRGRKRAPPSGFSGLRGKKAMQDYFDSINQHSNTFPQDKDDDSYLNGLSDEEYDLEHFMQNLNYAMKLRTPESPSVVPSTGESDEDKSHWQLGSSLE